MVGSRVTFCIWVTEVGWGVENDWGAQTHYEQSPPNVGAEPLNQRKAGGREWAGWGGGTWKAGAATRQVHLRTQSLVSSAKGPEMERKDVVLERGGPSAS